MTNVAKIAWCLFLASLTFGLWTFPLVAVIVAANLLLSKYHPEWYR